MNFLRIINGCHWGDKCPIVRLTLLGGVILILSQETSFAQLATGQLYTQSFDALANTGTGSGTPVTTGNPSETIIDSINRSGAEWRFRESDTNANNSYSAAASTAGDTYSYGSVAAAERALGSQQSGSLIPIFGARFTFSQAVASFTISYTGEQWRVGDTVNVTDALDFQYRVAAPDSGGTLGSGAWTDLDTLDFTSPNTTDANPVMANNQAGVSDGNAAGYRTARGPITFTQELGTGSELWIRWVDRDISGTEDGLGVDSFAIQGNPVPEAGTTLLFGAASGALLMGRWRRGLSLNAAAVVGTFLTSWRRRA